MARRSSTWEYGGVSLPLNPEVLVATIGVQTVRLANAHAELATAQLAFANYMTDVTTQAALDNAKAVDELKAWQAMNDAAVAARMVALQAANQDLNKRLAEIKNAPPDQDAPPTAELCNSLVRLRLARSCATAADRRH